jgi:hypothetical protein
VGLFEKEKIEFQRPDPYGWFTVVFPNKHCAVDSHDLDMWFYEATEWVKAEKMHPKFSAFAPSIKKDKKGVPIALSPVFFFKDIMDARRFEWRFSGELVNKVVHDEQRL